MRNEFWLSKINLNFFALSFALLLINIPWWNNSVWWSATDSAFIGQSFYAFYNEFFYHHELIRWFPYGTFGMAANHWQLFDLTPASYLTIFFGTVFRFQNVLLAFKLSLLLEQWMMLIGIYLFCGKIFKHEMTRFFVSLSLIASTVWFVQIYWNFRIYCLLPLVLYCFASFFQDKSLRMLLIAVIIEMISLFGVPTYFVIPHFLVILLFGIGQWFNNPELSYSLIQFRKKDLILVGFAATTAASYLFLLKSGYQNVFFTSGFDRDASQNFQVPLRSFLDHGMSDSLHGVTQLFQLFFPTFLQRVLGETRSNINDVTLYIGLTPIVFAILGIFVCVKNKLYLCWALLCAFFIFLMLGSDTPFATHTYEFIFPLRYFRYLNGLAGFVRFLLIVLAGFGLDAYLSVLGSPQSFRSRLFWAVSIIISMLPILLMHLNAKYFEGENQTILQWPQYYQVALTLCLVTGVVMLVLFIAGKKTNRFRWLILPFFVLDVLIYQSLVFAHWTNKWEWADPSVSHVHRYEYQKERSLNYNHDDRMAHAFRVVEMNVTRAGIASHAFLQSDPCLSQYVTRFWPNDVFQMINSRWPSVISNGLVFHSVLDHPDRLNFFYATGCYVEKLRLYSSAVCVNPQNDAYASFNNLGDLSKSLLIESGADRSGCGEEEVSPNPPLGDVRVVHFSFNQIELEATIFSKGAWLYYPDTYDSGGWSARVDGKNVQIQKANLAFKALWLESGSHQIRMRYFKLSDAIFSGWIALVGIFFAIVIIAFGLISCLFRTDRHDARFA